ncbi:MAG: VOC family protein [Pseudomonadota bacterium]
MINATRAYPVLAVANLDSAITTYTERMGFHLDWRDGDAFAAVSSGPVALFLRQDAAQAGSARVVVNVEDVDATHAAWVSAGVTIVDPLATRIWGMREFVAADQDGNRLTIGHVDESEADFSGITWSEADERTETPDSTEQRGHS